MLSILCPKLNCLSLQDQLCAVSGMLHTVVHLNSSSKKESMNWTHTHTHTHAFLASLPKFFGIGNDLILNRSYGNVNFWQKREAAHWCCEHETGITGPTNNTLLLPLGANFIKIICAKVEPKILLSAFATNYLWNCFADLPLF